MKRSRVQFFAHRGANKQAPENSFEAFKLALENKVDGIETDIQITKDGKLVLWHNEGLSRLGIPHKNALSHTWDELKGLDISKLCHEYAGACNLCSFEDFFDLCLNKTRLLLEIKLYKSSRFDSQIHKIKQVVNAVSPLTLNSRKRILVSSFSYETLEYANCLNRKLNYIANSYKIKTAEEIRDLHNRYPFIKGICFEKSCVNQEVMDAAKALELITLAYTCNTKNDFQKLEKLGIDIVISDDVREIRDV